MSSLNEEMQSLALERDNPRFDVRQLTYILDGDQKATLLKEKFMLELERDPLWRMDDITNLSLAELRERTLAKARLIVHFLGTEPLPVFRQRMAVISVVDPAFWTRIGVHYGLFFGALQSQANPDQMAYWISKGALACQGMYGCFCMTELKHGSYIQGFQTTATFDPSNDQFVIHSPNLGATKWWIGGAAQSATHGAVYAQMYVKGQCHGVKVFIVPLRDPKTFQLLPGVSIGDLGKKMGRDGIDNGWVRFTYVRIPRSYMLMKHTRVKRDGTVISPPMEQLAYGALIQGRVAMVVDSGNMSKKALTIAIRYAAIRRQFKSPGAQQETKLLDYVIHQHRVLPLLAQTFAMHFAGVQMDKMYVALTEQLDVAKPGDASLDSVLSQLKETHATSAGLKAHCTWMTLNIIEQCRQTLGGHGYSSYTELSRMVADWAVQCSWEGDNTILTLQTGRSLVSNYRDIQKAKGKSKNAVVVAQGVAYLAQIPEILSRKCSAQLTTTQIEPELLQEAFDVASACLVHRAATEFETGMTQSNGDSETAYEQCAHARFVAAKTHCSGYLFARFHQGVCEVSDPVIRSVLMDLLLLYGTHWISEHAGDFLQSGFFSSTQLGFIHSHVGVILKRIRRDAVLLVDAFNLSDYAVNSPMGRFDGNIYESYFNQINRLNPTPKVHPYFESTVKPLLFRSTADIDGPELNDDE